MVRVIVVDDHDLVRHAITSLLGADSSIEVVGQGRTGNEAAQLYDKLQPDVLLLDLQLPGKSGIRVSQQLLRQHPEARIVILSASINEFYLTKLQKIGVLGFVSKNADNSDLLNAIHSAAKSQRYFCQASIALAKEAQHKDSAFNRLTKQEFDVVLQLAYGMSVEDITKALCIDSKTVYFHKNNAFNKLEIQTTAELTFLAMQNGLYPKTSLKPQS